MPPSSSEPKPAAHRRGTNQTGVRLFNERLVLSLVRDHGALTQAEIARRTDLSPPSASAIVKGLERDGLLVRRQAQRGRVGQPSTPLALNPEGAFAFGLKIGRRSLHLILMDFVGALRGEVSLNIPYPTPEQVIGFVREGIPELMAPMNAGQRERIAGLGIAMPFELSKWEEEVGAPPGALDGWQTVDLPAEIETIAQVPVHVSNDATAACAAEYLFGHGTRCRELLYVFIAWFIGGGVVLDGNLFPGQTGYAGSLGQILVPTTRGGRAGATQLLHCASLYLLAREIEAKGGDPSVIWEHPDDWTSLEPFLHGWIERAAEAIAHASISSVALAEFQAVVIDGIFPAEIRSRLVARVRHHVAALDCRGLPPFDILEGTIGSRARAIGGASLPFLARFMRDHGLLVREPIDGRA